MQVEMQIEMQIELWDKRTANLWDNKGYEESRWMDTERHFRSQEVLTFWITKEMRTGGDSFVEGPLRTHQLWQFYVTVLWTHGTRHLKLCYGKTRAKLVKKPCLTAWVQCGAGQVGLPSAHWSCLLWRTSGPSNPSLWSWECDRQRVSEWMVSLGSGYLGSKGHFLKTWTLLQNLHCTWAFPDLDLL